MCHFEKQGATVSAAKRRAADLCKDPARCGPSDQSARCLVVLGPAPFLLLRLLLSAEHLQDNTFRLLVFQNHGPQTTHNTRFFRSAA